jgi:hypothetical protein
LEELVKVCQQIKTKVIVDTLPDSFKNNCFRKKICAHYKSYIEIDKRPGPNSKHFVFFLTYEWTQEATVFFPWQAIPSWHNVTLLLIWPICKLQRK